MESNLRDVNSLLQFHNVHPQVRADVQRRLQLLLHRLYEHFGTLKPGYSESPHSVCAAIVNGVINDTLSHVIPGLELAAEEKRSAGLEQRICDLEDQLRESDRRYEKLEKSLTNVGEAHEFMLRHYFREVLILRYRLQDAASVQKRLMKNSLSAPSALQLLKSSGVHTKLQQSALMEAAAAAVAGGAAAGEVVMRNASQTEKVAPCSLSASGLVVLRSSTVDYDEEELPESTLPAKFSYTTDTFVENESLVETEGVSRMTAFDGEENTPVVMKKDAPLPESPLKTERTTETGATTEGLLTTEQPRQKLKSTSGVGLGSVSSLMPSATTTTTTTTIVQVGAQQAVGSRVVSQASKPASLRSLDTARRKCEFKTVSTQTTVCSSDERVDAIFDYEQYIRTLHYSKKEDNIQSGQNAAISGVGPLSGMWRKGLSNGFRFMNNYPLHLHDSSQGFLMKGSKNNLSDMESFLSRAVTAVKPLKTNLLEDLGKIYRGVRQLQTQRAEDMKTLQSALELLQVRVDVAMDFIEEYATELDRLAIALIQDDSSDDNRGIFANDPRGNPFESRAVHDYFVNKANSALRLAAGLEEEEKEKVRSEMQRCQDACNYWDSNKTTLHARKAFVGLQAAALHLRKKNICWSRRMRNYMPGVFGAGSEQSNLSMDEDELLGLINGDKKMYKLLSREEKLKSLVQLRMKRIAYRARHRNCLRRLADGANKGWRCDGLQRVVSAALSHENMVDRLTHAINKLLRELQVSEADAEDERLFFLKNLAFSPYLNDTLAAPKSEGRQRKEGEEDDVVYVPLPVRAEHAGDLCATLASNQTGYIIFCDEIIPIATTALCRRSGLPLSLNLRGGAEGDFRRDVPFHGTVHDYTRGVQMGRPLGDTHQPVYVFWDTERGSFYVVDEDKRAPRHVGQRPPQPPPQQQQQKQVHEQHQVRLATILLNPDFSETAGAYSYARKRQHAVAAQSQPQPLQRQQLQPPVVSGTTQQPFSSRIPVSEWEVPVAVAPSQHGLQPYHKTNSVRTALVRPVVVQPGKREEELMCIKSYGARQGAGVVGVTSTSQPSGTVTALARLKEEERQRARAGVSTTWASSANSEARQTANRPFLRLNFSPTVLPAPPAPE